MKYILPILFMLGLLNFNIHSQTLEEAKSLYLEEKYTEALPAFEKAIKSSPKNPSYNQWYGTCLLKTGNVADAEKYLKFASTKNIPEAFNSLGKMYFEQYRFKESVEAYEGYTTALNARKTVKEAKTIDPMLEKSRRAVRMLSRCENIQLIDSVLIDKKDFLRCYHLGEESGTLHPNYSTASIVYENQLKDRRYYAKKNKNNLLRLYTQVSLQNKWSDEKTLNIPCDSIGNDDFPFVLTDGVTLYYASTGHNSIGGFDLFVTRYNSNTDSFLAPEQLGMPFNSIYNDYMLAIDEFNEVGYFVSDRFQAANSVIVYTFIPNNEIKTVDSQDTELLSKRARITSIQDTWIQGVDYASLLKKSKDRKHKGEQKKKDFTFVINDNIVYHFLTEFESDAAKQIFVQSQALGQKLMDSEKQLENKRLNYANASASKKKSLAPSILADETALDDLYKNFKDTEIKARNTEIKYLRQKH